MTKLGLKMAVSKTANTLEEAQDIAANLIGRFPIIIRPAFTLGGTGGGIAYNQEELVEIVTAGIDASMTNQVCSPWEKVLFQLCHSTACCIKPRW